MEDSVNLTASAAKYILKIYETEKDTGVKAVALAKALGYSRASVCRMLYVLIFDGYAEKSDSGEVRLTRKGRESAEKLKRCVEIVADYLHKVFGCPENLAKADAFGAVVNLSSATVEKILSKSV